MEIKQLCSHYGLDQFTRIQLPKSPGNYVAQFPVIFWCCIAACCFVIKLFSIEHLKLHTVFFIGEFKEVRIQ